MTGNAPTSLPNISSPKTTGTISSRDTYTIPRNGARGIFLTPTNGYSNYHETHYLFWIFGVGYLHNDEGFTSFTDTNGGSTRVSYMHHTSNSFYCEISVTSSVISLYVYTQGSMSGYTYVLIP